MQIPTLLIGLGRIAFLLEKDPYRYHPCTHAGSLRHLNEMSRGSSLRSNREPFYLLGVSDLQEERIDQFQSWWKREIPLKNTDATQLIKEARAPFVILATTLESHHTLTLDAIRNGARGILLEKPATRHPGQVREILKEARKRDVRVWINFERRYHPAYRKVRQLIEKETLGKIRNIRGRVLTGSGFDSRSNTGPLLHDAVHWIDLLLWMVGKPRSFRGEVIHSRTPGTKRMEERAHIDLIYPDFRATLESAGDRRYFEFLMEIDFEGGRIRTGNDGHFIYKSAPSRKYKNFLELKEFSLKIPTRNPWVELYSEIARELKQGLSKSGSIMLYAPEGLLPLQDTLTGIEIIDSLYKSACI